MDTRATALIDRLRLQPHPEGGYFGEVFRSAANVQPCDGRQERAAVTTIYFLLAAGQHSRWHLVHSDEVWHFYEGDALDLLVAPPLLERVERVTLGADEGTGKRVHAVPAGWWQAARTMGSYSLVGCTVAPGFDFADFRFLRDDARAFETLDRLDPDLAALA